MERVLVVLVWLGVCLLPAPTGWLRAAGTAAVATPTTKASAEAAAELDVDTLLKAAERGDADAQCSLGRCYGKGTGVTQDYAEAFRWYGVAADQGYAQAQRWLGMCYVEGTGVARDYAQAVSWFRKAAEQGDADALYDLGVCYAYGAGLQKDAAEAARWYRKASDLGHARAQFALGSCCSSGTGVAKDEREATRWFRMAAEQGDPGAQYNMGWSCESGTGVAKDLKEAVDWYLKGAVQGDPDAQYRLGVCYNNGDGIASDKQEAIKWFRKAAEQGQAGGQFNMGWSCETGTGVTKDARAAVDWYRKAAEQGHVGAQYSLGVCYDVGNGVARDKQGAARWFRKAAEQGFANAQYNLGVMSLKGEGLPQDYTAAYMWFNLAAAGGFDGAAGVRDKILLGLTPDQAAEGQRRAAAFSAGLEVPKAEPGSARGVPWASGTHEATAVLASGTGFFVSVDGYFLTAAHVVAEAHGVQVRTDQGLLPARVISADTGNDVALLKVEGLHAALPVAPSKSVKAGASVFTVGFPNVDVQGFAPKLTKGDVNSLSGAQDDPRAFQISVAVQPGNSGGPLIDRAGNVVGLVVARLDDAKTLGLTGSLPQNVNYALKSSYILPMLEAIPDLAQKLPAPRADAERPFDAVAREAEAAVCLVLVY